MRKLLPAIAIAVVAAFALPAVPASAQEPSLNELAERDCRDERRDDPAEFREDYGSGSAAIRRCVRDQRRDAVRECREELREHRAEYRREYGGTGREARRRCLRDKLD